MKSILRQIQKLFIVRMTDDWNTSMKTDICYF